MLGVYCIMPLLVAQRRPCPSAFVLRLTPCAPYASHLNSFPGVSLNTLIRLPDPKSFDPKSTMFSERQGKLNGFTIGSHPKRFLRGLRRKVNKICLSFVMFIDSYSHHILLLNNLFKQLSRIIRVLKRPDLFVVL